MRTRKRSMPAQQGMFEQVINLFAQLDTDRDRVPDYRDCQWLNPKKHGIRPSKTMRKRLEKLPIFVSSRMDIFSLGHPINPRHIMQKEAKKLYPKETTAGLAVIKRFPNVVGQMEKMDPRATLTFVMRPGKEFGITHIEGMPVSGGISRDMIIFQPPEQDVTKEEYLREGMEFIKNRFRLPEQQGHIQNLLDQSERIIFKDDSEIEKQRKIQFSAAKATFHEIEHIKQSKDVEDFQKRVNFEKVIPYYKRESEKEAIAASKAELKKRLEKGEITPGMYNKILGLD